MNSYFKHENNSLTVNNARYHAHVRFTRFTPEHSQGRQRSKTPYKLGKLV